MSVYAGWKAKETKNVKKCYGYVYVVIIIVGAKYNEINELKNPVHNAIKR